MRPYLLYVLQFVVGIYTNMKALQHSNIDTVIVFRASCPLAVCVLEWAFLGRQLPNCRSCLALLCIVFGTCGYVSADKSFGVGGLRAYSWVIAYTLVTATQMAYGKYIVGPDMKFASMCGRTPSNPTPTLSPNLNFDPNLNLNPNPSPNPNPNPNPDPNQVGPYPVHQRAEYRTDAGHRALEPRARQAHRAERARARPVDAARHLLPGRLLCRGPRHLLHRMVLPLPGHSHVLHGARGGQQDGHGPRQPSHLGRARRAGACTPCVCHACTMHCTMHSPFTVHHAPHTMHHAHAMPPPPCPPTMPPHHGPLQVGILWLTVCIAGATGYQQAPLREEEAPPNPDPDPDRDPILSRRRCARRRWPSSGCSMRAWRVRSSSTTRESREPTPAASRLGPCAPRRPS